MGNDKSEFSVDHSVRLNSENLKLWVYGIRQEEVRRVLRHPNEGNDFFHDVFLRKFSLPEEVGEALCCILSCRRKFQDAACTDRFNASVHEVRAELCDFLAFETLENSDRQESDGKLVQSRPPDVDTLDRQLLHPSSQSNLKALDVGIRSRASRFLSSEKVQYFLEQVWLGQYVPGKGSDGLRLGSYTAYLRSPLAIHLLDMFMMLIFLGLAIAVSSERSTEFKATEVLVHLYGFSLLINFIRLLVEQSFFMYFRRFWNCVDVLLTAGLMSFMIGRYATTGQASEAVFVILSFTLLVGWFRFLLYLEPWGKFCRLLVMIPKMLGDLLVFLVLLTVLYLGFASTTNGVCGRLDRSACARRSFGLVGKALLGQGWLFEADELAGALGETVLAFAIVVLFLLMFKLLIAMFVHSYDAAYSSSMPLCKSRFAALVTRCCHSPPSLLSLHPISALPDLYFLVRAALRAINVRRSLSNRKSRRVSAAAPVVKDLSLLQRLLQHDGSLTGWVLYQSSFLAFDVSLTKADEAGHKVKAAVVPESSGGASTQLFSHYLDRQFDAVALDVDQLRIGHLQLVTAAVFPNLGCGVVLLGQFGHYQLFTSEAQEAQPVFMMAAKDLMSCDVWTVSGNTFGSLRLVLSGERVVGYGLLHEHGSVFVEGVLQRQRTLRLDIFPQDAGDGAKVAELYCFLTLVLRAGQGKVNATLTCLPDGSPTQCQLAFKRLRAAAPQAVQPGGGGGGADSAKSAPGPRSGMQLKDMIIDEDDEEYGTQDAPRTLIVSPNGRSLSSGLHTQEWGTEVQTSSVADGGGDDDDIARDDDDDGGDRTESSPIDDDALRSSPSRSQHSPSNSALFSDDTLRHDDALRDDGTPHTPHRSPTTTASHRRALSAPSHSIPRNSVRRHLDNDNDLDLESPPLRKPTSVSLRQMALPKLEEAPRAHVSTSWNSRRVLFQLGNSEEVSPNGHAVCIPMPPAPPPPTDQPQTPAPASTPAHAAVPRHQPQTPAPASTPAAAAVPKHQRSVSSPVPAGFGSTPASLLTPAQQVSQPIVALEWSDEANERWRQKALFRQFAGT